MKKLKQILAICGCICLCTLYLLTLFFALTDHSQSKSWLSASIYATFFVPVILYLILLVFRNRKEKNEKPSDTRRGKDKPE